MRKRLWLASPALAVVLMASSAMAEETALPIAQTATVETHKLVPVKFGTHTVEFIEADRSFLSTVTQTASTWAQVSDAIYEAVKNYEPQLQVQISMKDVTSEQLISAVRDGFGKSEYTYGIGIDASMSMSSAGILTVTFTYPVSVEKEQAITQYVKDTAANIFNDNMTDFQKVRAAYEYIITNTNYAQAPVEDGGGHSIYSIVKDGIGVCQAYALLFHRLMEEEGIESKYIVGVAGGINHAWNLVTIDGKTYHIDATYGDPVFSQYFATYDAYGNGTVVGERTVITIPQYVTYNTFLMSEEQLAQNAGHIITEERPYTKPTSNDFAAWHNVANAVTLDGKYYYYQNKDTYKLELADFTQPTLTPIALPIDTVAVSQVENLVVFNDRILFLNAYKELSQITKDGTISVIEEGYEQGYSSNTQAGYIAVTNDALKVYALDATIANGQYTSLHHYSTENLIYQQSLNGQENIPELEQPVEPEQPEEPEQPVEPETPINVDEQSPTIHGVDVLSGNVQAGNAYEFEVMAEDASGIKKIYAVFQSPSGMQKVSAIHEFDTPTNNYVTSMMTDKLSPFAETGQWFLQYLYVEDGAGNYTEHTYSLGAGIANLPTTFVQVEPKPLGDQQAPIVTNVEFTKKAMTVEEQLQFSLNVEDETAVQHVYVELTSPSGKRTLKADVQSVEEGKYVLQTAKLSPFAELGAWYVSKIYVEDTLGNFDEKLFDVIDTVATIQVDAVNKKPAPVVEYINREKDSFVAGEQLFLFAKITNESLFENVYAELRSPNGKQIIKTTLLARDDANQLYTLLTDKLPPFAEIGHWYVHKLYMEDAFGNYIEQNYERETTLLAVEVVKEKVDEEAPVSQFMFPEPLEVSVGQAMHIPVKVTDASGVENMYVKVSSPTGKYHVDAKLEKIADSTDEYVLLTNNIDPLAEAGEWYISYVYTSDEVGNYAEHTYTAENTLAKVSVNKPQVDEEAPIVTNVVAPEKNAQLGEQVPLEVKVTDNVSGVSHVQVKLTSPSGEHTVETLAEVDNIGENQYGVLTKSLHLFAETGDWYVSYVYVSDEAGNYREYTYNADDSPAKIDVSPQLTDAPQLSDDVVFEEREKKEEVPRDKAWTIDFSLNVDIATILTNNIYVTNAHGQKVGVRFIIDRQANGQASSITIAPLDRYEAQATYTLWIKDVMSTDGQQLTKNEKMQFTTTK